MFPPICGFHLIRLHFALRPFATYCTASASPALAPSIFGNYKLSMYHPDPYGVSPVAQHLTERGSQLDKAWAWPGPSFLTATNLGKGIDECSRLRSSHRSALIDLSFWPCWTYLNLANQRIIDPYIPLEFIASLHITSIHSSTPVLSLIGSCSVSHGLIRSPQHPHLFSSLYISKWLKWARLARGSSPTASAMALWLR